MKMSITFFPPKQVFKISRRIKELEDKLSIETQKYEETEREVSLHIVLTSLFLAYKVYGKIRTRC